MLNDQEAEFIIACDYLEETGYARQANILRQTRRINPLETVEPTKQQKDERVVAYYPTNLGWDLSITVGSFYLSLVETTNGNPHRRYTEYQSYQHSILALRAEHRWKEYWESFDNYREPYYLVAGNRIPTPLKSVYVNLVTLAPPYSLSDAIMPDIGYKLHKDKFASAYDVFCSIRFIHPLVFAPIYRGVKQSVRSERCTYTISTVGVFDLTRIRRTYFDSLVYETESHSPEEWCQENYLEMFTSNSTPLVA